MSDIKKQGETTAKSKAESVREDERRSAAEKMLWRLVEGYNFAAETKEPYRIVTIWMMRDDAMMLYDYLTCPDLDKV